MGRWGCVVAEFAADVIPGWDGVLDAIGKRIGKHPDHECGCPPWVLRCAHFGNRTLIVDDAYTTFHERADRARARYGVGQYTGARVLCSWCDSGERHAIPKPHSLFFLTSDLDAAEADYVLHTHTNGWLLRVDTTDDDGGIQLRFDEDRRLTGFIHMCDDLLEVITRDDD